MPSSITAGRSDTGRRLDVWLEDRLGDLTRSRIQSLIKSGRILVDGSPAKSHTKVHSGMVVTVTIPPPSCTALVPEPIPLEVLYEDGDVIVVNKPAGLVVHPAAGHPSGTLVNALLFHCRDLRGIGGELRPGIAHRLDKDTSGALVAAKTESALEALVRQFKCGNVEKEYLAVVLGVPKPPSGRVESLIGRSRRDRKKMSVLTVSGRRAVTHYELVQAFDNASLVSVRIETGRTHQIRVQMAHMDHPVLGDVQYGGRRAALMAPRQMLHARRLAFAHPRSGERVECLAPIPRDMQALVEALAHGHHSAAWNP